MNTEQWWNTDWKGTTEETLGNPCFSGKSSLLEVNSRLLKLDFWTLSIVPDCLNDKTVKKTNTTFQKLDLLPSSVKITKGVIFN
jgi:hypothetical protein